MSSSFVAISRSGQELINVVGLTVLVLLSIGAKNRGRGSFVWCETTYGKQKKKVSIGS